MKTQRKPYLRPMKATWWTKTPFYRFYMLREATAFPAIWVSLIVLYGLNSLRSGTEIFAEYINFLAHPLILLINLGVLLFALFHSKTWFLLVPKVFQVNALQEQRIVQALWATALILSILLIALAIR